MTLLLFVAVCRSPLEIKIMTIGEVTTVPVSSKEPGGTTLVTKSNLNGLYRRGRHSSYADGVNWSRWKGFYYSLKRTEMKVRPVDF